jgi:hypothetical protein
LIVAGEGFFKLVITLAEKGIDNVVGDVPFVPSIVANMVWGQHCSLRFWFL